MYLLTKNPCYVVFCLIFMLLFLEDIIFCSLSDLVLQVNLQIVDFLFFCHLWRCDKIKYWEVPHKSTVTFNSYSSIRFNFKKKKKVYRNQCSETSVNRNMTKITVFKGKINCNASISHGVLIKLEKFFRILIM